MKESKLYSELIVTMQALKKAHYRDVLPASRRILNFLKSLICCRKSKKAKMADDDFKMGIIASSRPESVLSDDVLDPQTETSKRMKVIIQINFCLLIPK